MGSFCAGNTQTQQQQQQTGTSTGTQQANTSGTTAQTSTPTYGGFVGSTLGGLGSSFAPGFSSIQAGGGSALPGVAPYIAQNSPFTQDVVKTTTDALNAQHARDLSGQMGAAAKAGTLTGSGTADIRRQSDNTFNTQTLAPTISNLNLQGYNSALGASTADQNRLLQSGSAFGSLAGTQAGLVPGLVNAGGGTNVGNTTGTTGATSSGTTSGNSNTTGQTTYNQSPLSNVAGAAGALGSLAPLLALSDERVKENIKEVGELKDGQKVYKYNLAGSPKTEIGLLAQEVEQRHPHAVDNPFGLKMVDYDKATKAAERPAHLGSGGRAEPASFHDKVGHAFSAFHKMRKEAEHGHKRHGFEAGGDVMSGDWNSPSPTGSEDGLVPDMGRSVGDPNGWGATVERAPAAPKASWDNFNKSLSAWNKSAEMPKGFDSAPKPMAMDTRNPSLEALAPLMQRRGYEGGGDVEPSYVGRGTDAPLPPGYDNPRGPDPARTLAAYGVERESPWGAFFRGLANTPTGNPSIPHNWASGIGNAAAERREEQRKQAQIIEQNAQLSGQLPTGGQTIAAKQYGLEAAKSPAMIAHLNAQTELAKMQADKDYQLELEKQKIGFTNEAALAKSRAELDQMFEYRKRMQEAEGARNGTAATQSNARLQWVPAAPAPTAAPEAPAAPTVAAPPPPAPAVPPRNNRGQVIQGTPQTPFQTKEQAGFGQYYRGADGQIYRRGNMRTGDSVYYGAQ